jgi:hypothetical protein
MIRLRTLDREITSLEFFLMVARLRADTRNPSDAAANRRTAPAAVGVEMCASDGQRRAELAARYRRLRDLLGEDPDTGPELRPGVRRVLVPPRMPRYR